MDILIYKLQDNTDKVFTEMNLETIIDWNNYYPNTIPYVMDFFLKMKTKCNSFEVNG